MTMKPALTHASNGTYRRNEMYSSLSWLCLFLSLSCCASEITYGWKAGDLYRFDYFKAVSVKQDDGSEKPEERKTELTGVLVIEIRNVSASGATGIMRIDSPRVTIPVARVYSAQADSPEMQPERSQSVSRAMVGAIKVARWSVNFDLDGTFRILARTPPNTAEWLKETGNAGGWRKKQIENVAKLIEQDLGLKASGADTEPLLVTKPPADPSGVQTSVLHPLRSDFSSTDTKTVEKEKLQIAFSRQFPKGALVSYRVPDLESNKPVLIKPKAVVTHEGTAVFDVKLSMLDSLTEDYTATLDYSCGAVALVQNVRVQYRLKRLAPAIRKHE